MSRWYQEVNGYNFHNPLHSNGVTGHFTQVVWRNSLHFGCARVYGQRHSWFETYVVCNYYPPGNFNGQNKEMVLPRQIHFNFARKI